MLRMEFDGRVTEFDRRNLEYSSTQKKTWQTVEGKLNKTFDR